MNDVCHCDHPGITIRVASSFKGEARVYWDPEVFGGDRDKAGDWNHWEVDAERLRLGFPLAKAGGPPTHWPSRVPALVVTAAISMLARSYAAHAVVSLGEGLL